MNRNHAERTTNASVVEVIVVVAASLLAGAVYAWFAGEDANWDWQNYHEYNVWAFFTGRYEVDVVPAGLQTYFNPLVYIPAYLLRHGLPPPYGGLTMGAIHGLNLALIYILTRGILGTAANAAALAASVLISATGAMTLSEVGTSFADILTALPIISALIILFAVAKPRNVHIVFAGSLIGVAVGFKLTNVVFALGAAAAVVFSARPLVSLACLGIGGAGGAILSGGMWSLMLWRQLGNPIFPLFNGVFHSPEIAGVNILDMSFLPRSFLDGLAYPLFWLMGDNRTAEFAFRDARFALLLLFIPLSIVVRIWRQAHIFQRKDVQLFVFFIVSYATWLIVFSIQRYVVVLELLCGPIIVLVIFRLLNDGRSLTPPKSNPGHTQNSNATVLSAGLAVAIALWGQPADWWRRPWSSPYRPAPLAESLQKPGTFFLVEKPLAYLAPRFPSRSRFYQLADIGLPILPDGLFDHRIWDGLADLPSGGTWMLHVKGHSMREDLISRYELKLDTSKPCLAIDGIVQDVIEACPLLRR